MERKPNPYEVIYREQDLNTFVLTLFVDLAKRGY